jgi:hypothetical protein
MQWMQNAGREANVHQIDAINGAVLGQLLG